MDALFDSSVAMASKSYFGELRVPVSPLAPSIVELLLCPPGQSPPCWGKQVRDPLYISTHQSPEVRGDRKEMLW